MTSGKSPEVTWASRYPGVQQGTGPHDGEPPAQTWAPADLGFHNASHAEGCPTVSSTHVDSFTPKPN